MKTIVEPRIAMYRLPEEPIVLIVNGDPAMRASIEDVLNAAGLHTLSFGSAAEYLDYPKPRMATCAILDVMLPDASGLDLQERLVAHGTPVLFVTRESCITSCVRALKAGAVDFLTMPCASEELLNAVRDAMARAVRARAEHEKLQALRNRLEQLTRRERRVFALVASGLLNKQAAQHLDISEITVKIHRGRVMRKMGAPSFAMLVRMADALQLPIDAALMTQLDQRRPTGSTIPNRRDSMRASAASI